MNNLKPKNYTAPRHNMGFGKTCQFTFFVLHKEKPVFHQMCLQLFFTVMRSSVSVVTKKGVLYNFIFFFKITISQVQILKK